MSNNKEQKFVSAVVYIHNNDDEVEDKLKIIDSVFADTFERYEIICVNDASDDSSVDKIKEFSTKLSGGELTVIHLSFYHGLEAAMNAGVDLAIGDFVYEFDTLCAEFPEEMLINVYQHCLTGFDIVSAGPERNPKLSSRIYYHLFNSAMHGKHSLEHDTFRIVTRRAVNRVHSMSKTIPFRKALYANCGLKIDCLHYNDDNSYSDVRSLREKTGFAFNSLILFTESAYKIAFTISIIMILLTIGIAAYALVIFFGGGNPIQGWTSTMLFLSIGFFGIFALFGVVLKYLSVIVNLDFNKQKYFVESVEKIVNRR